MVPQLISHEQSGRVSRPFETTQNCSFLWGGLSEGPGMICTRYGSFPYCTYHDIFAVRFANLTDSRASLARTTKSSTAERHSGHKMVPLPTRSLHTVNVFSLGRRMGNSHAQWRGNMAVWLPFAK